MEIIPELTKMSDKSVVTSEHVLAWEGVEAQGTQTAKLDSYKDYKNLTWVLLNTKGLTLK